MRNAITMTLLAAVLLLLTIQPASAQRRGFAPSSFRTLPSYQPRYLGAGYYPNRISHGPYYTCFGYCNGPLPGPHRTCFGYCPSPTPYYTCYGYCPYTPTPGPYYTCYGFCPNPLPGEYYPQIYPILDGNFIFTPS